jgi:hypothetical protein
LYVSRSLWLQLDCVGDGQFLKPPDDEPELDAPEELAPEVPEELPPLEVLEVLEDELELHAAASATPAAAVTTTS